MYKCECHGNKYIIMKQISLKIKFNSKLMHYNFKNLQEALKFASMKNHNKIVILFMHRQPRCQNICYWYTVKQLRLLSSLIFTQLHIYFIFKSTPNQSICVAYGCTCKSSHTLSMLPLYFWTQTVSADFSTCFSLLSVEPLVCLSPTPLVVEILDVIRLPLKSL